jgi:hypothetical protein
MKASNAPLVCDRGEEIGAYLDGELSFEGQHSFESHLAVCPDCSTELRAQQGLLRTLEFAFSSADPALDLPDGFSHLVALRAESDVSGFRTWTSAGRALRLSAALGIGVVLLLGIGAGEKAVAGPRDLALALLGILDLLSRFVYDLVFSLAVILRTVGRSLVQTPSPLGALSILLLVGAAVLLIRQVLRFHRS